MESITVASWQEFEEKLHAKQALAKARPSDFLYRGQGSAHWNLETTLERRGKQGIRFADYYRVASAVRPQIEAFTSGKWEIPDYPEVEKKGREYETLGWREMPAIEYLIHLRHHGFPSPLLDWTRSPHVAAFFAFQSAMDPCGKISIYVYWERPEGAKVGSNDEAQIRCVGPYVRTHRRHFLQQAQYTLCMSFADRSWRFASHQNVVERDDNHQEVVWKFDIPSAERMKVLKMLDGYNLNAFSLFQTEDSLMETMAFREIDLRERL